MKMSFVENCDLYLLSGTHFINLCKKGGNLCYFGSFEAEWIPTEIKVISVIPCYDFIICGYLWNGHFCKYCKISIYIKINKKKIYINKDLAKAQPRLWGQGEVNQSHYYTSTLMVTRTKVQKLV